MKLFLKFYNTPLYCAVQNNYIDIVKLLLDFPNIDVNIKSVIKTMI